MISAYDLLDEFEKAKEEEAYKILQKAEAHYNEVIERFKKSFRTGKPLTMVTTTVSGYYLDVFRQLCVDRHFGFRAAKSSTGKDDGRDVTFWACNITLPEKKPSSPIRYVNIGEEPKELPKPSNT